MTIEEFITDLEKELFQKDFIKESDNVYKSNLIVDLSLTLLGEGAINEEPLETILIKVKDFSVTSFCVYYTNGVAEILSWIKRLFNI